MYESDSNDIAHRRLALTILDASERDLLERFMRCDRREALQFLASASKGYQLRSEFHSAQAQLYQAAAEKIDHTVAKLRGGSAGADPVLVEPEEAGEMSAPQPFDLVD
jgi:hypothetical protein